MPRSHLIQMPVEENKIVKLKKDYSLRNLSSKLILGKVNEEKGGHYAFKKEGITLRFHRIIANQIVKVFHPFSLITPNRVTWFGFFLTIFSAIIIVIAGNNTVWLVLASILYWLSAIMDCVDGQLARKRDSCSKTGEWLDYVLEAKGIFLWIAIGFNISLTKTEILGLDIWFLISIALGFLGFLSVMSIYSSWLFEETQPISHDHVYIVIFMMIFHLFELGLLIFDIGIIFVVIYTLIEKTFLIQHEEYES